MATDILSGSATNVINTVIIVPLMQQIDDVIHLDENRCLLQQQLDRMKGLLQDISYEFDNRQKSPPQSLSNCVEKMKGEVRKARELIECSQRPHQCLRIDCAFLFNFRLSTQIRKWKATFNELFDELCKDFSVLCSAQQIASFTPRQAETQIERLLTEAPHVRRIGVYGPAGVGKTTLLRKIYSTHKEVSDALFDAFVWVTVPPQFSIPQLKDLIASQLNLALADTERKMQLSEYLKAKKIFMVLEDMCTTLDLEQLDVELNNDRPSKLIFSTRNRDLIEEMKVDECMKIEAMSRDEGWDLFCKVAFKVEGGDHNISDQGIIESFARQVCAECKGLPLLINVIASSMIGNNDVNEWKHALRQMQRRDFVSPIPHHPRIDRDLFQRMRWSYDCLSDANLKNCFLYSAIFPQATAFQVNPLVHMWIAEGLVENMDAGHRHIKFLEDRWLFQLVQHQENVITVHDAVRDMAIYIGEREEKCVFIRTGQKLQDCNIDCKRISVLGSNIYKSLPPVELKCQNLVTLFLGKLELEEIPETFLHGLTSLKVLDVGYTPLKRLPSSLWELAQLEFLNLSGTEIESVHERIGNLSSLRFLYISHCSKLKSLPPQITKLESLKYLDFSDCDILKLIPKQITKLSNCKIVQ